MKPFKILLIPFLIFFTHFLWASSRSCEAIHLPYTNATAYRYLDHAINGEHSVNSDSLSIVQRLNPYYSDVIFVDSALSARTIDQSKIKVIRNPKAYSDQLAIVSGQLGSDKTFRFTLGKKLKHQADPAYIRSRMEEIFFLKSTDGISVNAKTNASAKMKITLKVIGLRNEARELVYLKKTILFESTFLELSSTDSKRIDFNWNTFTTKDGRSLKSEDYVIEEIFFEVAALQKEAANLTLYLDGPMYIEQFSSYNGITDRLAGKYWDKLGVEQLDSNGKVFSRTTYLDGPIPVGFRKMIYNKLHSGKLAREALLMLKKGLLKNHLEALGFEYKDIDYKFVTINDQFKFFQYLIKLQIPIEIGTFGEYHGTQSHALQIYCITKGMSAEELKYFKLFYQEMGSNAAFGWILWNSVFDYTRPDTPRSPLYWAQKVRESNVGE